MRKSKTREVNLCSNCFKDEGLKFNSCKIGLQIDSICPACNTRDGRKLNRIGIEKLAYSFLVRGTIRRASYGAAPNVQFNTSWYKKTNIEVSKDLEKDIRLIEEVLQIGFFYYGPQLWMIGEVEPLKLLQCPQEGSSVIEKILIEYPVKIFSKNEIFYRLRKSPNKPLSYNEYDSPPATQINQGRLDSNKLSIMYGSQDIEICVHECRVTVEDELFLARLYPIRDLKLIDLTALVQDNVCEFESIDLAIHMLFLAGEHSYDISREIAIAVHNAGFDGLIYPSYFSLARIGAIPLETCYGISIRKIPSYEAYAASQLIPNLALFGRPIDDGFVKVSSINRLVLNKVKYDFQFGPAI